jgi:ATP-dependent Lon protease
MTDDILPADVVIAILSDAEEASDIAEMAAALEVTSTAAQIAEENEGKSDEGERTETPDVVPVLPLKETVVFPETMMPLAVGQTRSV